MRIKICPENAVKIKKYLTLINGKAVENCFTSYEELESITLEASALLFQLLHLESSHVGAKYQRYSSMPTPDMCKDLRLLSSIIIERGVKSWFLISVVSKSVTSHIGGHHTLYLTKKQNDIVLLNVTSRYKILPQGGTK